MKWRRLNKVLHRDVGYLIVGLTIVFGVSGLALNHRADWNPSYRQQKTAKQIAPLRATDRDGQVREALSQLGATGEPRNAFRPDPDTLQIFLRTPPTRSISRPVRSSRTPYGPARCSSN